MSLTTGEFISYFRNETGLSQKRFAEQFDFSIASVPKWEKYITIPTSAVIKKLFDYCKKNNIEIYEYSWDTYIDEIFETINYGETYQRVGEYDESTGLVKIRCSNCGHESRIQLDIIGTQQRGSFCINCWLKNKNLSTEKYDVCLREKEGVVVIRHKECGRVYRKNLQKLRESGYKCWYCEYIKNHHII